TNGFQLAFEIGAALCLTAALVGALLLRRDVEPAPAAAVSLEGQESASLDPLAA
ncbi:MAG: hypothetical protein QOD66_3272, partial [Solirubrobacteraceae bacterium]|nr:hypothetical protein [Solirubrobacteraceae bacterium]